MKMIHIDHWIFKNDETDMTESDSDKLWDRIMDIIEGENWSASGVLSVEDEPEST